MKGLERFLGKRTSGIEDQTAYVPSFLPNTPYFQKEMKDIDQIITGHAKDLLRVSEKNTHVKTTMRFGFTSVFGRAEITPDQRLNQLDSSLDRDIAFALKDTVTRAVRVEAWNGGESRKIELVRRLQAELILRFTQTAINGEHPSLQRLRATARNLLRTARMAESFHLEHTEYADMSMMDLLNEIQGEILHCEDTKHLTELLQRYVAQ